MDNVKRRAWMAWAGVLLLVALCGVLAVLQYRWIDQVADAERARRQADLKSRLDLLARNFDERIATGVYALVPSELDVERAGREAAYIAKYQSVQQSASQIMRRIALAIPDAESIRLEILDTENDRFAGADWPSEWSGVRNRLERRLNGEPVRDDLRSLVVEIPRFAAGPSRPDRPREQEWLILELNRDYLVNTLLPQILYRYLGESGRLDYDAVVTADGTPSEIIYRSQPASSGSASLTPDATIRLLELPRGRGPAPGGPSPGGRPFFGGRGGGPEHAQGKRPPPPRDDRGGPPPEAGFDRGEGAWQLSVQHHSGSLEALVAQARRRNLALSAGILVLILGTILSLTRLSRQRQRMAELQMNFVSGVSHELRTPLAVIRTAGFNLRGKLARQPEQVERYGELIQDESEKLSALVEQVLRYGNANAGRVIRERTRVEIAGLIDDSLRVLPDDPATIVEKQVAPGLPPLLADQEALRHALQNLIDNAVKHGSSTHPWVGVFASAVTTDKGPVVEIRVADHGPGIPGEECKQIFDPFFRGRQAIRNQVHGAGLGLNLTKKIVEAHGGTIEVRSAPGSGTEFVVRIPAAPPEREHELAHSSG